MNTDQMQSVLVQLQKMLDNNSNMLKALSTLPEADQIKFFPSVMDSINKSSEMIKALTDATRINQLSKVV